MAEPKGQRAICLEFECLYHRYAREKLAQVYRILLPSGNDPIQPAEDLSDEKERSHLCQSFLGSATGTVVHDYQEAFFDVMKKAMGRFRWNRKQPRSHLGAAVLNSFR